MTDLPKPPDAVNTKDSAFAFYRFIASLIILFGLAVADLFSKESIPTIVYFLLGGLNGVDAYKLYREVQKS